MVKLAIAALAIVASVATARAYSGPLPPMEGWHEGWCGAPAHPHRCWVKDQK